MVYSRFNIVVGLVGLIGIFYGTFKVTTPGKFTQWSNWSTCPVTCGDGVQTRTRTCTAPSPGAFGLDCEGARMQKVDCREKPCPIDGGYTEWGGFENCDKSCGGGTRKRKRTCTKPLPLYGGRSCVHLGIAEETHSCNVEPCPVNGGYSEWGPYSNCGVDGGKACGKGKKFRTRICNKPAPQNGGKPCEGPEKESTECENPCPTLATAVKTSNTTSNATTPTAKSA